MKTNRVVWVIAALAIAVTACSGSAEETTTSRADPATTQPEPTTTLPAPTTLPTGDHSHGAESEADAADVVAATLATAGFQDVAVAEDAGYGSTIDALGCFHSAEHGGMGLHYLNESLMDDQVDITTPEALVYELDASGAITGLIAHEYIVPVEAWTADEPPSLFGVDFHQHAVLPLWVLHALLWKDNPAGMFVDYNPKVRTCPEGVPIFGVDLP